MYTLDEFNARLQREFQGRLRCRFVAHADEYHIEQKVGRAVEPPTRIHSDDDDAIRARDGYAFVMTIRKGDRMKCPGCGFVIKVPVMVTGEAVCEYCRVRGKDGKHLAGMWPLGDALIQHLRSIDPLLNWNKDRAKIADERNRAILEAKTKEALDRVEAVTLDDFRQLVGIPMTGWTPNTGKMRI